MALSKKFVIALGGSIAFPEKFDPKFLKKFCSFIKKEIKRNKKFIIVIGGGYISRFYQKELSKIQKLSNKEKDWIGIWATWFNARLFKLLFKKQASPLIFNQRFKIKSFGRYSLIIGAGWEPGWSTDFVACQIACDFGIKKVIVLGKAPFVYTADFQKVRDAKPLEELSWKDYLKMIPSKWSPGLHTPFDPIAALKAQKENLEVVVADGKDLRNLKRILEDKKFKGTILKNI